MYQLRSLVLLLAAISGRGLAAIGPSADLTISNSNISPDGFTRSAVLAGGTFPGPVIQGTKGGQFSINVINSLTDTSLDLGTSIHWHGLFQQHTNYVDGAVSVTQCPIVPNNSFLYDFNANNQAGTYWYHSHYRNQYCDGLRGALVIYDPDDPQAGLYDVDDESTIITLADWYHYLSTNAPAVPAFNSTLINGKGRYPGGPDSVDLAIINVTAGKRYRFRLVSISCDPNFTFSIDGHQLTIIEVDGTNVQPLVVDSIQIFAAQRYSFVLNANQPVDNYWVRSLPPGQGYTGLINLAVLRYDGAPSANPTTIQPPTFRSASCHSSRRICIPVPGNPTPGGADININLAIAISGAQFTVNDVAFDPPSVPVLLQILSGAKNASDLVPAEVSTLWNQTRAWSLPYPLWPLLG
ncbi:Cupredoxin, partial [Gloeopeniophorella convolvens]